MSIICAILDKRASWIASNTSTFIFGERKIPGRPLWYCCDGWAIGQTGDARTGTIINAHKDILFRDLSGPFDLTERLRNLLEKHGYCGITGDEGSVPCYGSSYLLTNGKGLWDIDFSFDISEYKVGGMAARGSGATYALGVDYALRGEKPKIIVEKAVLAAMEHDIYCGGEVWIKRIPR